ncbi:unnamed protein product [Peronospora destructor]|uniref:Uncharacterized protein n=1 Tax=Peronospora destructor TaxID=86335 RepID=A0AAV0UZ61_9STRA|nr:unnamed protein product [Peronospora destructor]
MLASPLPIPWKDVNQHGLHGVVEIHSSDFREKKTEEIRVRDVIAIVNRRVQEKSSNGNILREVNHLMLHGVRVNNNYPLDHIIPELAGSSPRLVATAQIRVKGRHATAMTLFVVTLSGKTITVNCLSTDTVKYVKMKIEDKESITPEAQRLVYAGKPLKDQVALSSYNIKGESTLHLSLRICGGSIGRNPAFRTFVDVSNGSLITALEFSPKAPEWRLVSKGMNIEGRCKNPECSAYRKMIIDRKKFVPFNLIRDDNIQCPMCCCKVKPITCGFYDCAWRFEGVTGSVNLSICSQWNDASGEVYHRFDSDAANGSVEWASLLILAKPRQEVPSAFKSSDTCTICWSPLSSPTKCLTPHCGHTFHRECSKEWTKWCKHYKTQPSCPICRRTN